MMSINVTFFQSYNSTNSKCVYKRSRLKLEFKSVFSFAETKHLSSYCVNVIHVSVNALAFSFIGMHSENSRHRLALHSKT